MQALEKVLLLIEPIHRLGIPYMVTGSVASIVYGEPRMTQDVDLVLQLQADQVGAFLTAYDEQEFYVPPAESVQAEIARRERGHFNIVHHGSGFRADVYCIEDSALQRWAMGRRKPIELGESVRLFLAPPEYVILQKLAYFKEGASDKHLRDIRGMWRLSRQEIAEDALLEWIENLGLQKEWNQALDPRNSGC